ncbi:tRNA ligase 1-like isoform X2 [Rutidosis leptorrhynchoides]|uniref:tRNA ligase 1-like isoform X2 n=1 Tax=Rutidosis leptorrhynchoides TaxID=125765 RepID=UPI003A99AB2B
MNNKACSSTISIRIVSVASVLCIFSVLPVNLFGRRVEQRTLKSQMDIFTIANVQKGLQGNKSVLTWCIAVLRHRVLNRVNHPGNLDKSSKNEGYELLRFYDLYNGMEVFTIRNTFGRCLNLFHLDL